MVLRKDPMNLRISALLGALLLVLLVLVLLGRI